MSSVFRLAVWFAPPPTPEARRTLGRRARATPARASSLGSAPRPASKAICRAAHAARPGAPAQTPSAPPPAPAQDVRRCRAACSTQPTPCPPQAHAACVVSLRHKKRTNRAAAGTHIAWCSAEMHVSGASPYALMTSNCGTPNQTRSQTRPVYTASRCSRRTNLLLHASPDGLHVRPHFSDAAHALLRAPFASVRVTA